jgi:diacylglycerol diphosphate phosphatase/phosphatidate phosphatase
MPNVLRTIKNRIREIYEDDSFPWSDTSYTFDWYVYKKDFSATILTNCRIVVLGFFLLDHFIRGWPVFERDFSPDDPLVQHPYTSQQ